jgi:CBS domain-containing protein
MSVETILKKKGNSVFTIRPEHSVTDAANLMTTKKIGALPVCDAKGHLIGLLSERDILRGMAQYLKGVHDMPVRNLMSSPVFTCQPKDSVKKLQELMTSKNIRHLPVVEGGELVGVISIRDLIDQRRRDVELEVGVLRDVALAAR